MSAAPWGIPAMPAGFASPSWGMGMRQGSGIPSDSLGNLGDRYFDTTAQRWHLKRWVVQDISGFTDLVTFPVPATANGLADPFDISFNVYDAYNSASNMVVSGRLEINSQAIAQNALFIELKSNAGVVQFASGNVTLPSLTWKKVRVNYDAAKTLKVFVDGANVYSANASAWSIATPATNLRVLSPVGSFGSRFCNLVVSDSNGQKINAPLDDGSGLTAKNLSWGGDGTLTTSGVWLQTWVPMNLL